MPWVISFVVSWVLFFALVDFKTLKTNVAGGILALSMATLADWGGQLLGLYKFTDLIIPWFGCSAFYKFGPVLTMGVIFVQYVPTGKGLQFVNIVLFAVFFVALEYLILQTRVAIYLHWHLLASTFVDTVTFGSLTWFTLAFLRKDQPSFVRIG